MGEHSPVVERVTDGVSELAARREHQDAAVLHLTGTDTPLDEFREPLRLLFHALPLYDVYLAVLFILGPLGQSAIRPAAVVRDKTILGDLDDVRRAAPADVQLRLYPDGEREIPRFLRDART